MLILSVFFLANCQAKQKVKKIEAPILANGDTAYWFREKMTDVKEMSLPDLTKSMDEFHIRIWSEYQAIDIWSEDNGTFKGSLSNYTYTADDKPLFLKTDPISNVIATQIANLYKVLQIYRIPGSDSIRNWQEYTDGSLYAIEFSNQSYYYFRDYDSPFEQTCTEGKMLDSLLREAFSLTDGYNSFTCFVNTLPDGLYHWSGVIGISPGQEPCKK